MNIKQALKKKNLLVEEIKQETTRVLTFNSIETGNTRSYSAKSRLENVLKLTDELIALKAQIQTANQPVYKKIYRLSELKSIVSRLKIMNCTDGVYTQSGYGNSVTKTMTAEIGLLEKDEIVKKFEDEINQIQDELDYFNHITEI